MINEISKYHQVTVVCRSPIQSIQKAGNVTYYFCESRGIQEVTAAELLSKNNYDCTYVADIRLAGFCLYRMFKRKNAGIFSAAIASLHSFSNKIVAQPEIAFLGKEEEKLIPHILKEGELDFLHVSSNSAKKLFKNNFSSKEKILIKNIGIPIEKFAEINILSNTREVLLASRNAPRKRLNLVEEIARKNKKLIFKVCGQGTKIESTLSNIKSMGLLSKPELFREMQKSDYTLSLSVHEVFANTLTEACCFGSIPLFPKIDPIQTELFGKIGKGFNELDFFSIQQKVLQENILERRKKVYDYAVKNFNATNNVASLFDEMRVW